MIFKKFSQAFLVNCRMETVITFFGHLRPVPQSMSSKNSYQAVYMLKVHSVNCVLLLTGNWVGHQSLLSIDMRCTCFLLLVLGRIFCDFLRQAWEASGLQAKLGLTGDPIWSRRFYSSCTHQSLIWSHMWGVCHVKLHLQMEHCNWKPWSGLMIVPFASKAFKFSAEYKLHSWGQVHSGDPNWIWCLLKADLGTASLADWQHGLHLMADFKQCWMLVQMGIRSTRCHMTSWCSLSSTCFCGWSLNY